MTYQGKEFKPYDAFYYVSADGEVYSKYKHGLMKPHIDLDGYRRVDIHGKHMKIHKLVYLTWVGDVPKGMQINHKDDQKDNNHYSNLYLGNQKQNIHDCIKNNHRVGHVRSVVVYDKLLDRTITYPSIKLFLASTGHSVPNGSLPHAAKKKWFQERYEIVQEEGVSTIESYRFLLEKHKTTEK